MPLLLASFAASSAFSRKDLCMLLFYEDCWLLVYDPSFCCPCDFSFTADCDMCISDEICVTCKPGYSNLHGKCWVHVAALNMEIQAVMESRPLRMFMLSVCFPSHTCSSVKFQVDLLMNLALSSAFGFVSVSACFPMSGCAKCSSATMCTSCTQALFLNPLTHRCSLSCPLVIGLIYNPQAASWQVNVCRSFVLWSTVLFCWLFCYFHCVSILPSFHHHFLLFGCDPTILLWFLFLLFFVLCSSCLCLCYFSLGPARSTCDTTGLGHAKRTTLVE